MFRQHTYLHCKLLNTSMNRNTNKPLLKNEIQFINNNKKNINNNINTKTNHQNTNNNNIERKLEITEKDDNAVRKLIKGMIPNQRSTGFFRNLPHTVYKSRPIEILTLLKTLKNEGWKIESFSCRLCFEFFALNGMIASSVQLKHWMIENEIYGKTEDEKFFYITSCI